MLGGLSHLSPGPLCLLLTLLLNVPPGRVGHTGDLKPFLPTLAQVPSGKAEQAAAAGAGRDQQRGRDIFLRALSRLAAAERNLRALGKEQRSHLFPFLAAFKLKEHIPQGSLMKTHQVYFYSFPPALSLCSSLCRAALAEAQGQDLLSVSLTLYWTG